MGRRMVARATMTGPKWHCFETEDTPSCTDPAAPSHAPSTLALIAALAITVLPGGTARPAAAASTDLFFSEYIEGSSNNKALEIYNDTGAAVNLATGVYNDPDASFNGGDDAER